MTKHFPDFIADTDQTLKEFIAEAGKAVPLGRMGTAEEYALNNLKQNI